MPAGSTYIPLASTTLTSAQQGITFTGISQSYTDLVLVLHLISKTAGNDVRVRVGNGSIDSGSNYSATHMRGAGTSATSTRTGDTYMPFYQVVGTSTSTSTLILNFQNYSNTSIRKTVVYTNSSQQSEVGTSVGLWRSTSAINQVYIYEDGNTSPQQFDTGTRATLYGIAAA